jgi:hypothetical protein
MLDEINFPLQNIRLALRVLINLNGDGCDVSYFLLVSESTQVGAGFVPKGLPKHDLEFRRSLSVLS